MPQPLSSKERALFSQVVKNYETKQYKKGLKAAEQILRKVPNHGDTQAMKALISNAQGNSDEAFALAKVALKNDMKSHVCWHVYGLLYRSQKNFEEAIKAYKFALKLEPESAQIQRDLALLQVQMRDYQGYIQSRKSMLQSKPGLRSNWTALAIAQHLSGELGDAERTLTTYEETLKSPPPKTDAEHAEAVLYKNTIIAELGETERALDHLDAVSKNTFDRTSVMEMRAAYLLKLGKKQEAEKAYRALLVRNADYREYYEGLERALGLDKTDHQALKELYDSFAEQDPRGDAPRRIPLDFLDDDAFREATGTYLQRMLNKGIPSIFQNIKALYVNPDKRVRIQHICEGFENEKTAPQVNGSAEKEGNEKSSLFERSTLYFLAQHFNYHRSRDLTKAMEYIDKAIELSPESVDFHMTKARILKHHGNITKAAEVMEKARTLDDRDRYINTKAAKYQLRNDDNETALKTMSVFTRNETAGGPLGDLHDMQCVWYITEDGESYLRQRKVGLALKRFTSILNIFEIWQEDQFDFHSFSLRKGQIRAYIEMIRWEDHLREHPYFSRVAISATKAYLLLHDFPALAHGTSLHSTNGLTNGNSSSKENSAARKKAEKKARKDAQKQEQIVAEKKDAKKTAGVGPDGEPKKEDKDPLGEGLAQTTEPLKEAMKFLIPLLESCPENLEAQHVGFEVYIRRKKYVLALRCLLAGLRISPQPDNPRSHLQLLSLQTTISNLPTPLSPAISEILTSSLSTYFPSETPNPTALNDTFLSQHRQSSPQHLIAGLQARQLLDPASKAQNCKEIGGVLELETLDLKDAVAGLDLLREWNAGEEDVGKYVVQARKLFPQANAFAEGEEGRRREKAEEKVGTTDGVK